MAQFDLSITLEYTLLSATNRVTFVELVNDRLSADWQPLGGPFVFEGEIYQAMVREKPKEETAYLREASNLWVGE